MLISKFDLYKNEWLELVFAKRNKEYGAYYIRQHYAGNIVKAMSITFVSITGAALIMGMVIKKKPVAIFKRTDIVLSTYHTVEPPKKEPEKPKTEEAKPSKPVTTTKYVPMFVTKDPIKEEPPKITDIKGEVGDLNIKVPGSDGPSSIDPPTKESGNGTETKPDNSVHFGADVMPEPFGGAAGWMKFLQKNLRYPSEALDKNMTGRVLISFVVEKDGSLSSLTVDRGAGFGMDEEALRVLKLSKAWKPGKQNGQPVRVKYTLPINFSLGNN